jgi:hypothetical protein
VIGIYDSGVKVDHEQSAVDEDIDVGPPKQLASRIRVTKPKSVFVSYLTTVLTLSRRAKKKEPTEILISSDDDDHIESYVSSVLFCCFDLMIHGSKTKTAKRSPPKTSPVKSDSRATGKVYFVSPFLLILS